MNEGLIANALPRPDGRQVQPDAHAMAGAMADIVIDDLAIQWDEPDMAETALATLGLPPIGLDGMALLANNRALGFTGAPIRCAIDHLPAMGRA